MPRPRRRWSLLAGLQGIGKDDRRLAKLALWFKQQGRHPLLVGADLQRLAAVEQLKVLGREVEWRSSPQRPDPVLSVARDGVKEAASRGT